MLRKTPGPKGRGALRAHLGFSVKEGRRSLRVGIQGRLDDSPGGECEGQRPPGGTELMMETTFWDEQISKIHRRKVVHVVGETVIRS